MTDIDEVTLWKKQAAEAAVDMVKSDMIVGLGTGSTAVFAVHKIANLLNSGALERIWGIPTSYQTAEQAKAVGIPLTTLADHPVIDLTIDGADEIDPTFNLIKGGGGALLREKIVAQASKLLVIAADQSKYVPCLGTTWAIPIEIIQFGYQTQISYLESLGAAVTMRRKPSGDFFQTDSGNLIADAQFGEITNPHYLAKQLIDRVGIVEHGLFLDRATHLFIAGKNGLQSLAKNN